MRYLCVLATVIILSAGARAAADADDDAALVSGPMVGHTTDGSVRIWARSSRQGFEPQKAASRFWSGERERS